MVISHAAADIGNGDMASMAIDAGAPAQMWAGVALKLALKP